MKVAGIDAHTTYIVVAIVGNEGELLEKPRRIRNEDREGLVAWLKKWQPGEVVVEASGSWPWLYELVEGEDFGLVLAHPKKLRAIAESNYKTDAIDAALLARMRMVDLIPEVYAKPLPQREQATLVRHRTRLVRMRTAAAGRIHAELHSVGLYMPRGRLLKGPGRAWVHECAWPELGREQRRLIRMQEHLIEGLGKMIRVLDRQIRIVGDEIPGVGLLQTIPGIGPYRALLIVTEATPISRFESPGHLVSYAGLAPRSSRSGKSVRYGPIPAGANRWLRGAFVQGTLSHCLHAKESRLTKYYEAQKPQLGWRVARVATARKMARAVHAMLRTGEVWADA